MISRNASITNHRRSIIAPTPGVRHSAAQGGGHELGEVRAADPGPVRGPPVHHPGGPGAHELQEVQVGAGQAGECGGLQAVQQPHLLPGRRVLECVHDLQVLLHRHARGSEGANRQRGIRY